MILLLFELVIILMLVVVVVIFTVEVVKTCEEMKYNDYNDADVKSSVFVVPITK